MVQIINDPYSGNVFGRLGKGIGQGLSEQVPKEVERYRLSKGLQALEKESGNLTPMQFFTRAITQPGITPQMVQSLGDLTKQQNMRSAYQNRGRQTPQQTREEQPSVNRLEDIQFANLKQGQQQRQQRTPEDIVKPSEQGQPQAVQTNPLREEAVPKKPWTPERRNEERGVISSEFPWMNEAQINEMASDNESRELAQPKAEQEIDTYNTEQANKIKDAFLKRVELLTQKSGPEVFKDITGEMLNNFSRTVDKDLRSNPKMTIEDAVNKRANQLLEIPKTKRNLDVLANRDILDKLNPVKKSQALDNLLTAANIFDKVGDNEELYNILKKSSSPEEKGFDLSPMAAAWIAYPRSKQVSNFTNSIKAKRQEESNWVKQGQYYASQIGKLIQPQDSILSIAREISNKDPYFSISNFFDAIIRDKQNIGLTDRQERELTETRDFLPNWGDMALFPIFRGGVL